jgi:GAF domain-containing protein
MGAAGQHDEAAPRHDPVAGLSFPDVPRLELDELLEQLIHRADDVLATQGRLRGLLRANAAVAADLNLPVVLRRIVDAARDLLGARYAALGVVGRDGQLEQFVHAGIVGDVVAEIGELPRGRGILGLLISNPVPIRLADLTGHPASAGFPAGHPPMGAFLGVPIRSGEEVFGNLYLTERSQGGEFTAEDEELAIALAAAAGGAIANARRFNESEQRRRWLAASGELTPLLLSGQASEPYELITRHALEAAEADFAALALPHGSDQVAVRAVSGLTGAELRDRTAPLEGSLAGHAITSAKPVLVTDYSAEPGAATLSADIGPMMVVPLAAGEEVLGALLFGRVAGRPGFTQASLQMATAFASTAAVTLELSQARADQMALARMEDHDRIASELHDHVVQELFALGIGMQGLAGRTDRPEHAARIRNYIDAIDKVIIKIRNTIFQLYARDQGPGSLQAQLLEILSEHSLRVGLTASIRFAGPIDTSVDAALARDILAVTREALTNSARQASAAELSLGLADGLVTLAITDSGGGLTWPDETDALASIRLRAEHHGGTVAISRPADGSARLTWTARLAT